jgi:hypothetical protein
MATGLEDVPPGLAHVRGLEEVKASIAEAKSIARGLRLAGQGCAHNDPRLC